MPKYILIVCLFFVFKVSAQNLVPNASFEDYINCPTGGGSFLPPFLAPVNAEHWMAATAASTDYFNVCSSGFVSIPDNVAGYQYAHSGEAYGGIYGIWLPEDWWDYREYMQVKLNEQMIPGHRYIVSYWISQGEGLSNSGIDQMGVAFLPDSVFIPDYFNVLSGITPQLETEIGVYYSDTENWLKIMDTLVAVGNERWMILGNFKPYTELNFDVFADSSSTGIMSYYYYDDICVLDLDSDSGAVGVRENFAICYGDTVVLNAREDGDIYIWQDGDTSFSRIVADTGIYLIKTIDLTSCVIFIDTFVIETGMIEVPLNIGNDTSICNSAIILDAFIDISYAYYWSTGDTTSSIVVDMPGVYYVYAVNDCYFGMDTIIIKDTLLPKPIDIGADTSICLNIPFEVDASRDEFYQYLWSTGDTTSTLEIDRPGFYYVFALGECFYGMDTIAVSLIAPPSLDRLYDTIVCEGTVVSLEYRRTGLDFVWSTGETGCCIEVTKTGEYIAIGEDVCGRQISDSVTVLFSGCDVCVQMPSAFSPNGDGINDYYRPVSNCIFRSFKMDIYNRWGERVFVSFDVNTGWDGTYMGRPADAGVYYYVVTGVSFLQPDKDIMVRGDVTLLR